jgi:hypothetical protein
LIRRTASADFQEQWLPAIATGESIVVLAHADARRQPVTELNGRPLRAESAWWPMADAPICCWCRHKLPAATADCLRSMRPVRDGVSLRAYPTLDGQRAADLSCWRTHRPCGIDAGAALDHVEAALDIGLAALCAEAVGIMEATVAATTDYLKTRQQFGQPIGRFQALQHRMADMLLHLEQARSMSYLAAMHCSNSDKTARQRRLSAAKVTVGQACRYIAQNAVQLHGGMGMTDELMLSHWFKRLTTIEMSFGDTDSHLARFAKLSRAA